MGAFDELVRKLVRDRGSKKAREHVIGSYDGKELKKALAIINEEGAEDYPEAKKKVSDAKRREAAAAARRNKPVKYRVPPPPRD